MTIFGSQAPFFVAWGLAEMIRRANETLPQHEWDALEQLLEWKNQPFLFSSSENHPETEKSDSPRSLTGLELAMTLAVVLVRKGSEQLAASDEGFMLEEIETCLQPVMAAANEQLSGNEVLTRWLAMLELSDECRVIDFRKMMARRDNLNGSGEKKNWR